MNSDKEKAASEYADVLREKYSSLEGIRLEDVATWIEEAVAKGVSLCQPEIDALRTDLSESQEREKIASKIIQDQRKEIEKLKRIQP